MKDFYQFYGDNLFLSETSATQGGMDSLLNPKGAIKNAQAKAAACFGAQKTFFVTNGTSTSNKIVMQANLQPGDIVFVSSDCHKSVPYGVMLSGARAVFLQTNAVIEYDLYYNTDDFLGFYYLTATFDADSYDGQRDQFLGMYRDEANPIAVAQGKCSNSAQTCYNHCGALHKQFVLQPGEKVRFSRIPRVVALNLQMKRERDLARARMGLARLTG